LAFLRHFTAIIFASVFSRFPANPENYYHGKKVRVSGKIKEYQGKPEIILNNPAQIEILK
jgi:micrococcal nuclease